MRNFLMKVFFGVVLSLCLFSTVFASEVESSDVDVEIGWGLLTADRNMRSGPYAKAPIVVSVPNGTKIPVYEVVDDSAGVQWYKIAYNGESGYMKAGDPFVYTSGHCLLTSISMSTSCTDDTFETTYCMFCDWEEIEVIPAPGHDLVSAYSGSQPGSSFSCETGGYKLTWCKRDFCSYSISEEILPGHVYNEVSLIEPTYHSSGTQTMECERCGHRDYITIPALVSDGMSADVFSLGKVFMSGVWKLFGVYVPGFGFTFGGMFIGIALVSLSLSVIYMIFGFGRRGGGVSARTGSTNKPKISKERSDDEF